MNSPPQTIEIGWQDQKEEEGNTLLSRSGIVLLDLSLSLCTDGTNEPSERRSDDEARECVTDRDRDRRSAPK